MRFTETNRHQKFPGISAHKRELAIQQVPTGLRGRKTRCFFWATATITTGRFLYLKSNTKPMSTGHEGRLHSWSQTFQSRSEAPVTYKNALINSYCISLDYMNLLHSFKQGKRGWSGFCCNKVDCKVYIKVKFTGISCLAYISQNFDGGLTTRKLSS